MAISTTALTTAARTAAARTAAVAGGAVAVVEAVVAAAVAAGEAHKARCTSAHNPSQHPHTLDDLRLAQVRVSEHQTRWRCGLVRITGRQRLDAHPHLSGPPDEIRNRTTIGKTDRQVNTSGRAKHRRLR